MYIYIYREREREIDGGFLFVGVMGLYEDIPCLD